MRIVMLTDDVQIDRRILLEAESLSAQGHEVVLLAEAGSDTSDFERIGNVKVERVRYPAYSAAELAFIKLSTLLNRALGYLSSKVRSLLSLVVAACFSVAIRLNQFATRFILLANRRLRKLPLYERTLLDRIDFYDPDVIHVHDLPRLRVGVKAKRRLGVPLVYDAHELYPEIATLSPRQRKMLTRREKHYIVEADAVITVNEFIADEMADRYNIKKPHVVLNATNWPQNLLPKKHWDRFRDRFNIPKDHKILLFQGWMSASRGLQPLVRSISQVSEGLHLVFMGYGEAREELESVVAEERLDKRVHFMDAVPQSELLSWTCSADAGIIPYQAIDLNNYYCSPNKLFEFIQAELPIIANDLPFLRKLIVGEGFGIVHSLDSIGDYAHAINQMFNELRHNAEFFVGNLRRGKAKYSWDAEEGILLNIYQQL